MTTKTPARIYSKPEYQLILASSNCVDKYGYTLHDAGKAEHRVSLYDIVSVTDTGQQIVSKEPVTTVTGDTEPDAYQKAAEWMVENRNGKPSVSSRDDERDAALAATQTELAETKARLARLEQAITKAPETPAREDEDSGNSDSGGDSSGTGTNTPPAPLPEGLEKLKYEELKQLAVERKLEINLASISKVDLIRALQASAVPAQ